MSGFSESTHKHTFLQGRSTSLIIGMRRRRRRGKKWGGAKVDLSAAWSHPVVMTGHPLLRWQWEWQAYFCGHWCTVTDWTDKAVGACVEMTGCISISMKNLAKVANAAGWVRRRSTLSGQGHSLGTVFLLAGQSTFSVFLSLAILSSIYWFAYEGATLCVFLHPVCTANFNIRCEM